MSKVVREDVGSLSAVLTLTVTKADYEPKLDLELNKHRKKAQLKGFRKGKTPMGFIKKMYGRAILADAINELIQKELTNYISEQKIQILGQPLPSEDQEEFDFNINELRDYTFKFDIGLAPEFEVEGLSDESVFERYAVEVNDTLIEKDIEAAQKRFGTRSSVDEKIEENDVVTLNAEELDGDKPKEKGWATTFDILVSQIEDEAVKKALIGKKKGIKVRFNIFKLEKHGTEESTRKYLLNVGENDAEVQIGENFEAVVEEIKRVEPAELNQEFFDKYMGEGVAKNIEEVKSKIEADILKYYDRQSESLLFRDFQDFMLEKNKLELPDTFLKKWLIASSEQNSADIVEKEYDNFAKNLQWSLIKGKIAKKFDLKVEEEEVFEGFKARVRNYFQGYGDELVILNTANRLMQDEKQVDQLYQELMSDKLFEAVRDVVTVKDKKISSDDFDEVIKKAREEVMPPDQPENVDQITEAKEELTEDIKQ
jgi:trigger factor